jgi:hypothetical protein
MADPLDDLTAVDRKLVAARRGDTERNDHP